MVKHQCEVVLEFPLEVMVQRFLEDRESWQTDLISVKSIKGILGKVGSIQELTFLVGRREVKMTETVVAVDPNRLVFIYQAKGVWNRVSCTFESISPSKTKWVLHSEFKMKGLLRFFGWLMQSAFKKQSIRYMEQFKTYTETTG